VNGTTPSGFFKKEIENIILKAFEKGFKEGTPKSFLGRYGTERMEFC
jgi:hypothetical protein